MKTYVKLKKLAIILLILGSLLLNSCVNLNLDLEKEDYLESLQACGAFAVPGMYTGDLKEVRVSVLSIDSEGRYLFEYTTSDCNCITERFEMYAVILQKAHKNRAVFYYEDICYLMSPYTQEELDAFKKRNDWDQPLDEVKMKKQEYTMTLNFTINRHSAKLDWDKDDLESVLCNTFSISEEQVKDLCLIEENETQMIYFLSYGGNDVYNDYFALVDSLDDIRFLEITDNTIDYEGYVEFKKSNGWVYSS